MIWGCGPYLDVLVYFLAVFILFLKSVLAWNPRLWRDFLAVASGNDHPILGIKVVLVGRGMNGSY